MGLREAVVWLGLAERDDEVLSYDEDPGEETFAGEPLPDSPAAAPATEIAQIATVRPQTFRDALIIGGHFRRDTPVIINLQDLETADAKRIVDFMSGLIFGRRGDIQRLSSRVFLIVPPYCRIVRQQETLPDAGFYNQS